MAFRLQINLETEVVKELRSLGYSVDQIVAPILSTTLSAIKHQAVQNLSGVSFTSKTGTHTINKRTGRAAASVQVEYPLGSPYKGRVYSSVMTQYPGNPEVYNYPAVLEYGRGEVRPKYTPSMRNGKPGRAALAIPGGPYELVSGRYGFRGQTGKYRFVKSLPPMEGKYWLESAVETASQDIPDIVNEKLRDLTGR